MSVNSNAFVQDSDYFEAVVTIERQEAGFGFRIVGGTEEGSQVSNLTECYLTTASKLAPCCEYVSCSDLVYKTSA